MVPVLRDFYGSRTLSSLPRTMEKVTIELEKTGEACPGVRATSC